MQQPMFGWGGWGRATAFFDEDATFRVQTDGMWIIVLGSNGVVGLTVFYIAFILPVVLFLWRFPAKSWGDPRLAAGSLTAVLLGVYMIDCLLNAFPNIIYVTLAGGLSSLDPRQLRAIAGDRRGIEPAGRRAAGSGRLTLADRCRAMGRSFKQEGRLHEAEAAWRQSLDLLGALLDADPGSDELRRRWCDCANDLAWLMANHPDPSRRDPSSAASMALRAVDEYPDVRGLLEHAGGRPLPRRRRPLGRRRPRSRQGPGRRHGLRRRLPGHGARTAGRSPKKPGGRSPARCSRRSAITRAIPSWPPSATRPTPCSPAPPSRPPADPAGPAAREEGSGAAVARARHRPASHNL